MKARRLLEASLVHIADALQPKRAAYAVDPGSPKTLASGLGCVVTALFVLAARQDETFVKSYGVAIKGSRKLIAQWPSRSKLGAHRACMAAFTRSICCRFGLPCLMNASCIKEAMLLLWRWGAQWQRFSCSPPATTKPA